MIAPALTPPEEAVRAALTKLVKYHLAHPSGGFDPDDVSIHCRLSPNECQQHLHTLTDAGLVNALDVEDFGSAYLTHYTLPL